MHVFSMQASNINWDWGYLSYLLVLCDSMYRMAHVWNLSHYTLQMFSSSIICFAIVTAWPASGNSHLLMTLLLVFGESYFESHSHRILSVFCSMLLPFLFLSILSVTSRTIIVFGEKKKKPNDVLTYDVFSWYIYMHNSFQVGFIYFHMIVFSWYQKSHGHPRVIKFLDLKEMYLAHTCLQIFPVFL